MSHLQVFAICVGTWRSPRYRFMKAGNRDLAPFARTIEEAAKIPGVTGVELSYPGTINEDNLEQVTSQVAAHGLSIVCIASSVSSDRQWDDGSFTARVPRHGGRPSRIPSLPWPPPRRGDKSNYDSGGTLNHRGPWFGNR